MDYCECGKQATGRCARGGEFFCRGHQREYPSEILFMLQGAGQPPLTLSRSSGPALRLDPQEKMLLCRTCRAEAINQTMPQVTKSVADAEQGSLERIALMVIDARCWLIYDHGDKYAVGPDILTALAGHRPPWYYDNALTTATVLYAVLARSRSLTPPPINIVNLHQRQTHSWWSGHKVRNTTTPIDTIRAWTFTEYDDGSRRGTLLVGEHGSAYHAKYGWPESVDGTVTLQAVGLVDYDIDIKNTRNRVAEVKDAVESRTPHPVGGFSARLVAGAARSLLS